jgi:hypothetical protein
VEGPTQTFLYATKFADGIPGCSGDIYDLGEFAAVLKSDPGNVGRIVIGQSSRARYLSEARGGVKELRGYGIPSSRIVTVYRYVRPNRLMETTELWVVPPRRRLAMSADVADASFWEHRCPQGGLASIFRC